MINAYETNPYGTTVLYEAVSDADLRSGLYGYSKELLDRESDGSALKDTDPANPAASDTTSTLNSNKPLQKATLVGDAAGKRSVKGDANVRKALAAIFPPIPLISDAECILQSSGLEEQAAANTTSSLAHVPQPPGERSSSTGFRSTKMMNSTAGENSFAAAPQSGRIAAAANGDAAVDGTDPSTTATTFLIPSVDNTQRIDVVYLYDHLKTRCETESARRGHGVCLNHERIYSDVFSELTRQVTVLCPERGLLLHELSKDIDEAQDTFDFLFESSREYAVRKAVERDLSRNMLHVEMERESDVRRHELRVHELQAKLSGLEKRFNEQRSTAEKRHEDEVTFLKRRNAQLFTETKRHLAWEKLQVQQQQQQAANREAS